MRGPNAIGTAIVATFHADNAEMRAAQISGEVSVFIRKGDLPLAEVPAGSGQFEPAQAYTPAQPGLYTLKAKLNIYGRRNVRRSRY